MKTLAELMRSIFKPEQPALRVALFGAVGGALAVLASLVADELKQAWYIVILPYIALGAGAAFACVFVLLGIKTEDVWRSCGVALLAGFFWQPVFAASKEYVLNQPQRAAEAETAKAADRLEDTLTQLRASPTNIALVERAGSLAETLTTETADLRPSPAKSRAQFLTARTLDVLTDHAEKGKPEAAEAVVSVAESANKAGNRAVLDKAKVQVSRLPDTTNRVLQMRKMEVMKRIQDR